MLCPSAPAAQSGELLGLCGDPAHRQGSGGQVVAQPGQAVRADQQRYVQTHRAVLSFRHGAGSTLRLRRTVDRRSGPCGTAGDCGQNRRRPVDSTARRPASGVGDSASNPKRHGGASPGCTRADGVLEVARRARAAAPALATAGRRVKDAALDAMADALEAADRPCPRGQRQRRRGRPGRRRRRCHARPAAAGPAAGERDGRRAAPAGRAARPGRRRGPRLDPAQRARHLAGTGAAGRRRHHLRGPAQRDRRRCRAVPQERQCRAAARFVLGASLQPRRSSTC